MGIIDKGRCAAEQNGAPFDVDTQVAEDTAVNNGPLTSVGENPHPIIKVNQPEEPPPLPPRPSLLQTATRPGISTSSDRRPSLQSKPTTAISSVDIQTLSFPDGTRGTFSVPGSVDGQSTPNPRASRYSSEADDSASFMSCTPTFKGNADLASLLDDGLNSQSPAWRLLNSQAETGYPFESADYDNTSLAGFEQEFDEIEGVDTEGGNEGPLSAPSTVNFY